MLTDVGDINWANGVNMVSTTGGAACSSGSSSNGDSMRDPSTNFAPTSYNRRASSSWNSSYYPGSNAVDGNYNSYWAS